MALINFLRFSRTKGAIVADEEFWTPRFRKRLHTDCLHSLLSKDMSERWGMEIVYGGTGYPSVHREVVAETRRKLEQIFSQDGEGAEPPALVRDVARKAFESMQSAIRRRIDQKLKFKFGFDTDDFNRGYFESESGKVDIKNKIVKDSAKDLVQGKQKDSLLKPAIETRAAIFGFDKTYGITGFYLDSENGIMAYNYEGFEAIGSGKYASGIAFGKFFGAKTLSMRQDGFAPEEGLLELVNSAIVAGYHFKEVGGNVNIVYIDGERKRHSKRYREIFDNESRVIMEIVKAYSWHELRRSDASELIAEILHKEKEWTEVEAHLMQHVKNPERFELLLRNYKKDEVDLLLKSQTEKVDSNLE